ncbi:hypothetical protein [Azohydromonas aeria]|uniref:hypothetical protein n=1 Tax=Azohydromonas aeria TaxID=2590212 RepID=UPI0012F7D4AB|nr:hypothetical protein [Azohydromonas aeria]
MDREDIDPDLDLAPEPERDPDPAAGCAPRTLARAGVGKVLHCADCGQVHLQLGPVTLRLTVEAFAEMAGLVQSAGRALRAPDAGIGAAGTAAVAAPVLH